MVVDFSGPVGWRKWFRRKSKVDAPPCHGGGGKAIKDRKHPIP